MISKKHYISALPIIIGERFKNPPPPFWAKKLPPPKSIFHSKHDLLSATFSNFKADNKLVFVSFFISFGIFPPYYRVLFRLVGHIIRVIFMFFSLDNVEVCDLKLELRIIIRNFFDFFPDN